MKSCESIAKEVLMRRDEYERKKKITRQRWCRNSGIICLCAVLLLSAVFWTGEEEKIGTETGLGFETTGEPFFPQSNLQGGNEISDLPPLWAGAMGTPYAVIRIDEITDETVELSQDHTKVKYRRVVGAVEMSFFTDEFSVLHPQDGSGVAHVEAFDSLTSFYLSEASMHEWQAYQWIMISVKRMNLNGAYYYGAVVDEDGKSEFYPLIDGKLQVDSLEKRSFLSLSIINETIREIRRHYDKGGNGSAVMEAFPKNEFASGMTMEEIQTFFSHCSEAIKAYREE